MHAYIHTYIHTVQVRHPLLMYVDMNVISMHTYIKIRIYVCMYVCRWDHIQQGIAAPYCGSGKVRGGSNALVFAGVEKRYPIRINYLVFVYCTVCMYVYMYVCMYVLFVYIAT